MTKKQLSKQSGISISRIGQLMVDMIKDVDYKEERRGLHDVRIVFTESGISKVMNRNTKGGRKLIPKEMHAKRKKKIVIPAACLDAEMVGKVDKAVRHFGTVLNEAVAPYVKVMNDILPTIEKGGEV